MALIRRDKNSATVYSFKLFLYASECLALWYVFKDFILK